MTGGRLAGAVMIGVVGAAAMAAPAQAELVLAIGYGQGDEARLEQEPSAGNLVLTVVSRRNGKESRKTVVTIKDGARQFAMGHAGALALLWEDLGNACPAGSYRIVNLRTGALMPVTLKDECDPVAWSVLDRGDASVFTFDQGNGRIVRLTVTQ